MKQLKKSSAVEPGFVWRDPVAGHVVACGDACDQEFVSSLCEEPVHLALADPPYAISSENRVSFGGKRKDQFLDEPWDRLTREEMTKFLDRLCISASAAAHCGNVWIWTSDWWVSDVKRKLVDLGLRVWPTYVWCKSNPPLQVRKANLASACEFLAMASSPGNHFDLGELPKQRNWFVASPDACEFWPAVSPNWVERPVVHTVERLRKEGEREFLNRAQKPLDITEALVRAGVPEGGTVLDLCGGTGTALLAADRTGRRAVYVELDPIHVRAAVKRLREDRKKHGR